MPFQRPRYTPRYIHLAPPRRSHFLNYITMEAKLSTLKGASGHNANDGRARFSHFSFNHIPEIARDTECRLQEGEFCYLDIPSHDVNPIWGVGQIDLVGILMGYNGARDLLRHLRHYYDVVHLLPRDSTGWF